MTKPNTVACLFKQEMFFMEDFDGGMSVGYISPELWQEGIVPMMRARYFQMKNPTNE